jgi:dienelactone hydrolase
MLKLFSSILFISVVSSASELPSQPTDPDHPSSAEYPYTLKKESIQVKGRKVEIFLPLEAFKLSEKVPVVVFGHGQAIDVEGYELTFEHLARKGVAVIHPKYDTGFFDQNWRRMASDFNELAAMSIEKYSDYIDPRKVIYSGHSKGGYVALVAAGHPDLQNQVGSVILFAPAGFDSQYLNNINPQIPVTLIWSDRDTVIKKSLITEIYSKLPSNFKQMIDVKSYSTLPADHFFPLSKSYFFGGHNGASAYHYFATWKWLIGAAWDLQNNEGLKNTYIYGEETSSSGIKGLQHQITRNW